MFSNVNFSLKWLAFLLFPSLVAFCNNANTNLNTEKNLKPEIGKPSKRALLIGINDYPYVSPTLHGCINDVLIMKSMLIRKYNFPPNQVTLLLNGAATRASILTAFHQLITDTKKNDTIVIHYSGHGSQIPDKNEPDGLDETIIPYDYRDSQYGALPILDKQISNVLGELSAKTGNITIILDCCHSGGGTKDLMTGTEREIPADSRQAPTQDDFLTSAGRSISNKIADNESNYVLIAGCRSDQKSYEVKSPDGICNGILTSSLVRVLNNASAAQTWPAVVEKITGEIRQSYNQSPELAGKNRDSYVFGANYIASQSYFTITQNQGPINIDGGVANGITVGSVFRIYPPGTLTFDTEGSGLIEITKAGAFTSDAKLIKGKTPDAASRVVEYKHAFSKGQKLFLNFLGKWNGNASIIKQKMLALECSEENKQYPNLTYYNKGGEVAVYSGRDTVHPLESISLTAGQAADDFTTSVIRWDKWFRVANLNNNNSKLKVAVEFDKGKGINLDKADITYKDGAPASFTIQNNSIVPVFFYFLDLNDNADIEVYTLDAFITPGQTISQVVDPGKSFTCSLTPRLRAGSTLTRDVLKIFATSVAADFKAYEQSRSKKLSEKESQRSLDPGNKNLEISSDWTTLEKVIFVTK